MSWREPLAVCRLELWPEKRCSCTPSGRSRRCTELVPHYAGSQEQPSTGILMKTAIAGVVTLICASTAVSATPLDEQRVAQIAQAELKELGVPSSSVAIILDDRIVYTQAFGNARLIPNRAAARADRYQVGSISKEFLATALLLLQEDGQLSLDDPVGKYLPQLDSARSVTLRQLLSHTSGIRDFWPQDYVFRRMRTPISHAEMLQ